MARYLRLLRYSSPYRLQIAVSIACLFVASLLNAVSVASLQPAFDGLFGGGQGRQMLSLPPALRPWLGEWTARAQAFMQTHQMSVLTFPYMSPTDRPSWSAMMISTREGGMICARVPEAAI